MSNFIIHEQEFPAAGWLQVQTFKNAGLHRFVNQKRAGVVNELVLHETVTSSARATVDVILQRNLGVHFIIGGDGTVYQHGDLKDDFLWHASEHNPKSIGIEVVNPYYPEYMPKGGAWNKILKAPWAHRGKYVVPTIEQAEAMTEIARWVTTPDAIGLSIPRKWVGLSGQKLCMVRTPASQLGPGIYAHTYFGHADGAWLVLYAWLRMEAQLEAPEAYETACQLATDAQTRVDLSPYFLVNPYLPEQ